MSPTARAAKAAMGANNVYASASLLGMRRLAKIESHGSAIKTAMQGP